MLHTPDSKSAQGQLLSVTSLSGTRPGRVVVEVVGEVDTYTAPRLEVCLRSQAAQRGVHLLVVDLSRVTFLGVAGVTALAQAQRRCQMRSARLVIRTGGRRSVLRLLELTGLADLVTFDPAEIDREPSRAPRIPARPRTRRRRAPAQRRRQVSR